MNTYEQLEWIHQAIEAAIDGYPSELPQALVMVEDIRQPYLIIIETFNKNKGE